ncbi:MAG TPA: isopentenyl phosphate kinase, partial [Anaerolineae bacterium]|nr:isopentenyl phosphate kinase [Anaerolineae bacterium]
PHTARPQVLAHLAGEIAEALRAHPELRLVLGHGSGSYGHSVARRTGTRAGVHGPAQWYGFAEVAAAAGRLNRRVADSLLAAGVPAWCLAPSALVRCDSGQLVAMDTAVVAEALARGLVPLLYGDVAIDQTIGGTIVSTEQVLAFLARRLQPRRVVLISDVDGVFTSDPRSDPTAQRVPEITPANWPSVQRGLGASRAADVTGGMRAKVGEMVRLAEEVPGMEVRILSAERPGALASALQEEQAGDCGTVIRWL